MRHISVIIGGWVYNASYVGHYRRLVIRSDGVGVVGSDGVGVVGSDGVVGRESLRVMCVRVMGPL
jgi:hypothetical protein